MNIIQLNSYITLNGGSETVMWNVSQLLEEKGHRVTNIGYASVKEDKLMPQSYSLGKEKYSIPTFFTEKKTVNFIIDKINETGVGLVICHNVYHKYPLADLLQAIKKRTKAKLIMIFHDYKAVCPRNNLYDGLKICTACSGGKFYQVARHRCRNFSLAESTLLAIDSYYNNSFRQAYSYPDYFISPSYFLAAQLNKMGFKPNIEVIHNPINIHDVNRSKPQCEIQRTVLFASRLVKDKGVELFINAASNLKTVKFLIAGTGDLIDKVKDADRELDNFEYLGSLNKEQLFNTFDRSDYLVLPSIWYENNPMIIIEAMSYGLPVIGSDIGGIPELLESGRGFLFDPFQPGKLEETICELEKIDQQQYVAVAEKAKNFTQTLSADRYYSELCRLLPELAN